MKPLKPIKTDNATGESVIPFHQVIDYFIKVGLINKPTSNDAYKAEKAADKFSLESQKLLNRIFEKLGAAQGGWDEESELRRVNDRLVENDQLSVITGRVQDINGNPAYGVKIKAHEYTPDGLNLIEFDSETSLKGEYAIYLEPDIKFWGRERIVKLTAFGHVQDSGLDESEAGSIEARLSGNAGVRANDQKIKLTRRLKSIEYEVIGGEVQKILNLTSNNNFEYGRITNAQFDSLLKKGKASREAYEHLVVASALSLYFHEKYKMDNTNPPPTEFFFGLFRSGLLFFVEWDIPPVKFFEISRKVAFKEGAINPVWATQCIGHIVKKLEPSKGFKTILDLLKICVEDRIISLDTSSNLAVFATDGNELSKDLKTHLEKMNLDWELYVCGSESLRNKIFNDSVDNQSLIAVANESPESWVKKYAIEEEEAKAIALRLRRFLPGSIDLKLFEKNKEEQADASWLRRFEKELNPDRLGNLVNGPIYLKVCQVYGSNEEFDLTTSDFSTLSVDATHLECLLQLQRIARLTHEPKEALILLSGNNGNRFHSANQIRTLGRAQFIRRFSEKAITVYPEGLEADDIKEAARRIYNKAEERALATALCVSEISTEIENACVPAMSTATNGRPNPGSSQDPTEPLPNWETLFGSLDSCSCSQCASVHGAAAYLVDALEFLKRLNVGIENNQIITAFDVFNHRRPDISGLELNCENAHTPLPYIDLVCEILEDEIALARDPDFSMKIADGPISDSLVDKLKSRNVTNNAIVTTDYLGWKVVRDEGVTLLLEDQTKQDGHIDGNQPGWRVRQLRQTYRPAESLAAEPAYVNEAVYGILSSSRIALNLPFDLYHVELTAYLNGLKLKRADLFRQLATNAQWEHRQTESGNHRQFWNQFAAEKLKLTEAMGLALNKDWEYITCARPAEQHLFWSHRPTHSSNPLAPEPTPQKALKRVLNSLSNFRHFQEETQLTHEEILELFDGAFINPCIVDKTTQQKKRQLAVVHPKDKVDRCNTDKMRIEGLDAKALDRINRVLRLRLKQPEWRFTLIERILNAPALGNGKLDEDCLFRVAQLCQLSEDVEDDFTALLTFFTLLDTYTPVGENFGNSDYEQIFVIEGPDGNINPAFTLASIGQDCGKGGNTPCNSPELRSQIAWFAYCLNLTLDDAKHIVDHVGAGRSLDLETISQVYAWARLSDWCQLSFAELEYYLYLIDTKAPFDSVANLEKVLKTIRKLQANDLSILEVRYLLEHTDAFNKQPVDREFPQEVIDRFLQKLLKAYESILTEQLPIITDDSEMPAAVESLKQHIDSSNVEVSDIPALVDFFAVRQTRTKAELKKLFEQSRIIQIHHDIQLLPEDSEISDLWLKLEGGEPKSDKDPKRKDKETRQESAAIKLIKKLTTIIREQQIFLAQQNIVIEEVAALVSLTREEAQVFLEGAVMSVKSSKADSTEITLMNVMLSLTEDCLETGTEAAHLLKKMVSLKQSLDLDIHELEWAMPSQTDSDEADNRLKKLKWLSPDTLPISEITEPCSETLIHFDQLIRLLDGLVFLRTFPRKEKPNDPDTKYGAMDLLLESGTLNQPASNINAVESYLQDVAFVMDIPIGALREAAKAIAIEDDTLNEVATFGRWSEAVAALADLGLTDYRITECEDKPKNPQDPIRQLLAPNLGREEEGPLTGLDLRQATKEVLKKRTNESSWLETLKKINSTIREQKRDALVVYSLAERQDDLFKTPDDLYDYYLIDPLMSACMSTSRIVQAHGAIQAFVERCLMGLEPRVDVTFDGSDNDPSGDFNSSEWGEWKWMRNYRVWEANRKIFLYPENWIEPSLRDDKSEFFQGLEQQLDQAQLTHESAEQAARNYLEKLDEAASLEVMATHYEEEARSGSFIQQEEHILHVVARTKGGDPPAYFYRRFINESTWTPWERIELEINSNHIILFVRNGRLHLAWAIIEEFAEEAENPNFPRERGDYQSIQNKKGLKVQLALSEYSDGSWLQKQVSSDTIKTGVSLINFDDLQNRKARTRFYVLDRESADPFSEEALNKDRSFFILCYSPSSEERSDLQLAGAFTLSGCKSNPGVADERTKSDLLKIISGNDDATLIPAVKDATMRNQRWIEQGLDSDDNLEMKGLRGYLGRAEIVFGKTPGSFFQVTYPHQVSQLDRAILQALELPFDEDDEPITINQWTPSGTLMPFFYNDRKRGYVIVPGTVNNDGKFNSVYKFFDSLSKLRHRLEAVHLESKKSQPEPDEDDWTDLIDLWLGSEHADKYRKTIATFRTYLKGDLRLKASAFYHPHACAMRKELDKGGMEQLVLASRRVWKGAKGNFPNTYFSDAQKAQNEKERLIAKPYPNELYEFQFEDSDGYASYNWEIFYHLPSLVAEKFSKEQRFEEAARWLEFIFDPTAMPIRDESNKTEIKEELKYTTAPQKFWLTKPFFNYLASEQDDLRDPMRQRIIKVLEQINEKSRNPDGEGYGTKVSQMVRKWRMNPFNPHLIARGRWSAYQKATVIQYVKNLIDWGDSLFRQDTMESTNLAAQKYNMAKRILGPRPQVIHSPHERQLRTYRELAQGHQWDDFSNAIVQLENHIPFLNEDISFCGAPMRELPANTGFYFCIPRNEKLLELWDTIADRLFKLRHCQNIDGVERQLALFAPPIDPAMLVRAFAAGVSIGDILSGTAGRPLNYRFRFLLNRAKELTQATISYGSALLQALEKKDAEELSHLRSSQEVELLKMVKEVKLEQIREAQYSLDSLRRSRQVIVERRNFYRNIKRIIGLENRAMNIQRKADRFEKTSQEISNLANILNIIPDICGGGSGFGGSPHFTVHFGGKHLGAAATAASQFHAGRASLKRSQASQIATSASYIRRWDDWLLQRRLAEKELRQIDRQISAAEVRVEIAKAELQNHEKQTTHAEQVFEFNKNRKFTNKELYEWMATTLSTLYYQSYQLAYKAALKAESSSRFELRESKQPNFITREWAGNRKGLLAGEQLLLKLNKLENYHTNELKPNPLITKSVSLVRLDPIALLLLKYNSECEIELDEDLFDLDYPGHYLRRLKKIVVEIPAVTGSGVAVNYTMTLLKSEVRTNPIRKSDDDELEVDFYTGQPSSVSGALNELGYSELSIPQDQYLPFEGAGAISRWKLSIPVEDNRHLDRDSITDVTFKLFYSSRPGSSQTAQAVRETLLNSERSKLNRLISLKDEFPAEWQALHNSQPAGTGSESVSTITFSNLHQRMPYLWRQTYTSKAFTLGLAVIGESEAISVNSDTEFKTLSRFPKMERNEVTLLYADNIAVPDFDSDWKIAIKGTVLPENVLMVITPISE